MSVKNWPLNVAAMQKSPLVHDVEMTLSPASPRSTGGAHVPPLSTVTNPPSLARQSFGSPQASEVMPRCSSTSFVGALQVLVPIV